MPQPDHRIELNCFLRDDDPRHIFPIKIASTESVGTLKKAIKEEMKVTLEYVDAVALQLWNVSIPVDGSLKERVKMLELRDEEELSPVVKLLQVFPNIPVEGNVHIVAYCPPPDGEYEYSDHLIYVLTVVRPLQRIAPLRGNP